MLLAGSIFAGGAKRLLHLETHQLFALSLDRVSAQSRKSVSRKGWFGMQARMNPEAVEAMLSCLRFQGCVEFCEKPATLPIREDKGEIDIAVGAQGHDTNWTRLTSIGDPDCLFVQFAMPVWTGFRFGQPGASLRRRIEWRAAMDRLKHELADRIVFVLSRRTDLDFVGHARHPRHTSTCVKQEVPMTETAHRPRRSALYMPGANTRALEKAKTLPADMLLLDLEDAVAPEAKAEAREAVTSAVKAGGYGAREVVIRINGLDTEWGLDDLKAAVESVPDGILAPKVIDGGDIDRLDDAMSRAGASDEMGLWVMIEMPKAILNIQEIAEAVGRTRLAGFVMGTNDLAKELRAKPTSDRIAFQASLGLAVAAARAYDLVALDGVFNAISDESGLVAECEQGRALGFDGKTLIHPSQLEPCNRVFSPDPQDVEQARDVIEAFAAPENAGKGVIKVNGKMTELLHLEEARRLVAVQAAIEAMAG